MHYVLIYDLAPDYLERRSQFRKEHLDLAWKAADDGDIVVAGALEAPVDTAMLVFQGDSPAAAEAFARSDPYVKNGLVTSWRVRRWNTVVGPQAATPVRMP
ncbi:MAG TPA: YciI-like protein [Burkholderiales bacterium]|nr:YciI-like protein [Burkholderiales bacterium]